MKKKGLWIAVGIVVIVAIIAAIILVPKLGAKKEEEPVLNIFTWEGYIDYETVIKPFEEETGIKVNYSTFASNEEMYEKLKAAKGGDYDIILASDYMLNTVREAGLMQKFDTSIVTNFGNLNVDFTHQYFDPDSEYVVPYVSGIPLIVYNPDYVDIDIKGFNDLWDESLKDSIGLIDDARVTIGMVLLSMGQSMNTTDEAILAEAAEKLDAQELRPLAKTLAALAKDAQERITYLAQREIRDEIAFFTPTEEDINYPDKLIQLKSAPLAGCSGDDQMDLLETVQRMYATWYPSLQRTLMLLSKLYLTVDVNNIYVYMRILCFIFILFLFF